MHAIVYVCVLFVIICNQLLSNWQQLILMFALRPNFMWYIGLIERCYIKSLTPIAGLITKLALELMYTICSDGKSASQKRDDVVLKLLKVELFMYGALCQMLIIDNAGITAPSG